MQKRPTRQDDQLARDAAQYREHMALLLLRRGVPPAEAHERAAKLADEQLAERERELQRLREKKLKQTPTRSASS